ncbi:hypothetical protein O6H91_21G028300 [Diphasiastrum complanatum]|uniref:Uncharacterized protein n=1 Tax=Diphasiastrum complanatum TaxID=34168 RepID=A0ACC2AKT1_DIPCM|nr:hypothetical protein O6H91_21G028300 [Diphasiastrum complanatum]
MKNLFRVCSLRFLNRRLKFHIDSDNIKGGYGLLNSKASLDNFPQKEQSTQSISCDRSTTYTRSKLSTSAKMQVVFLGTSMFPTANRSASSAILRFEDTSLLFDCGEGTFRQLQRTTIRPHDIDRIFIRGMKPDYIFGLPSFLCSKAMQATNLEKPIEVFGPQGLRRYIRANMRACFMRVPTKFMVHEFVVNKVKGINKRKWSLDEEPHEDELIGKDISCFEDGSWHLFADDKFCVKAIRLDADSFCWGYVVEEVELHLKDKGLHSLESHGKRQKVVFAGYSTLEKVLAVVESADVLVYDVSPNCKNVLSLEPNSSGTMAGQFAKMAGTKCLVLTRFEDHADQKIKNLLHTAGSSFGADAVIAAKDFMVVTVGSNTDSLQ